MSEYELITCFQCGNKNRVLTEKRLLAKCGNCKGKLLHLTLYEILEIGEDSSQDEIKQAYRKLAMKWHPDKNQENMQIATTLFKKIRYAYEVLSDPVSRKKYDASLQNQNKFSQYASTHEEMEYDYAAYRFEEEMFQMAYELAFQNKSWNQISPLLIQRGCPEHIAKTIASSCVNYRKSMIRRAAFKPFIIGLVAFGIGGVITFATYNEASKGGGAYLVAYGPIIYGIYQMLVALKHILFGKVPVPRNLDQ
ncbi:J domain-containing protein [Paenibacillus sp. KQZ6P-2]|uniref:J domain-containing protein n=1 Tax=Paenibacillus mangrovi TaxID=2931978 RepID=A0A9X1WRM6_9BACL|nr:J domain-containing protein [Paenibacillus mangrovi]MCJ8013386.1 J domain-containing protein [Paenibacillus mangrovi]